MIEVTDEMVSAAEMIHRHEGTTREALEAALSAANPIAVTDAMVQAGAVAALKYDPVVMQMLTRRESFDLVRASLTAALSAAPPKGTS